MLYKKLFILCNKIGIILFFLSSCDDGKCLPNFYKDVTSYKVNSTFIINGINIDKSEYINVDLSSLGKRLNNIEECIKKVISSYEIIPDSWECVRKKIELQPRECIIIKIVPPIYSTCSDWQFTNAYAPDELCIEKGFYPTKECPCRWRSAIQNDVVLITPPNLYLWDIIRIYTGCNNIWKSPLSQCTSL